MRITKATLRNIRTRLDQTVKDMFKMDDVRLRLYVKSMWSNLDVEKKTREELLRVGTLLTIQNLIPDTMTL